MNIAFINPEYPSASARDHGGIATYIYNQANALASLGHTVYVLARDGVVPDPLHKDVRFRNFNHIPLSFSVATILRRFAGAVIWERGWSHGAKHLLLQIHAEKPLDIVEVPEYNGMASELRHDLPFSVVVHFHTPTSFVDALNLRRQTPERISWYRFEQSALKNADGFKCTSRSLKDLLPKYCKVPGNKDVAVIVNPMPSTFADQFGFIKRPDNPRRFDILFSGRLERRKGAEIVLAVINDILQLDERINLTFAGETDFGESQTYRQAIERVLKPGLRDRVWFLGPVERVKLPALYRQSDIFIIPSLFDNAPNSLFEAMAAKVPVIASDVGGMNEILRHDENGLLFPLDSPAVLVERVRTLVESSQTRARLAEKAYEDIVTLYTPERIAQQTISFYENIRAVKKSRRPPVARSVLRSVFQRLPVRWKIRLRGRVSLMYNDAGYGDSLLVAAVAREIKRAYGPVQVTVNGAREEMLRGNPNIDHIGKRYDGIDLNYHYGHNRIDTGFTRNLLDIMCSRVGIANPQHTVDMYFQDSENIYIREVIRNFQRPIVTIQTTAGPYGAVRKSWPASRWQEFVARMRNEGCTVVQLGGAQENSVKGAVDRLGKQDIRHSIVLLREADVHVGVVSVFMHAAQAVHTPAVILFGGFERFSAHGYEYIHPFESDIDCAPCAEPYSVIGPCPRDSECMKAIEVDAVVMKVKEILAQKMQRGHNERCG